MRFSFFMSVIILLLCSCYYKVPVTYYVVRPKMELSEVERPHNAKVRYGEMKINSISDSTSKLTKYSFADSMVNIVWFFEKKQISFVLHNLTPYTIKINWDDAAFVSEDGVSHKVIHKGVKYIDKNNSLPPSIIVRKAFISDLIIPSDYIDYKDGFYTKGTYQQGKWDIKDLVTSVESFIEDEVFNKAESLIGSTCQVLLPLEIEGIQNDYIFTFTMSGFDIKTTKETEFYFK